jgi:VWFA-related protein
MRVIVAILVAGLLFRQQPAPIRVNVRLVQVNVIARDSSGGPITDLTKDDFELFDNGKPQAVSFFALEAPVTSFNPPTPLPEHVFSNRLENNGNVTRGVTIVLFDFLNSHFTDQAAAKKQLIGVLRQIQPGQRIGVYLLGRKVSVLYDFTDHPSELDGVLARLEGQEPHELITAQGDAGERPADLSAARGQFDEAERLLNGNINVEQDYFNIDRATVTLRAFESIANHVAPCPGRKTLVWISGSFPFTLGVTQQDFESLASDSPNRERGSFQSLFDSAMRAVNNADLAIYPVDARGLIPSGGYDPGSAAGFSRKKAQNTPSFRPPNLDSMENLANKSGGRAFFNSNDLQKAINAALDDGRVSYTLGFYATSKPDNKFHSLKVQVRRKNANLRYRQDYLASGQAPGGTDPKAMLQEALAAQVEATSIGITAKLEIPQAKNGSWNLITSLDPRDLAMEQQGQKWVGHLQIVYSVQAETGKELGGLLDKVDLDLKPESWNEIVAKGLILQKKFNPPANAVKVRVAVYDAFTGRIGSISVPLRQTK